VPIWKTF